MQKFYVLSYPDSLQCFICTYIEDKHNGFERACDPLIGVAQITSS